MAIGSSSGQYYPDESAYIVDQYPMTDKQKSDRKEIDANTTSGDFQSRFGAAEQHPLTPTTMPLEGRTEATGALNSSGGTQVPEKGPTQDYDYNSWKAANPGVEMQPGQHYPDTYKLPNHMTFSDESIYHGQNDEQGGHWNQNDQGKWDFTPGPSNLKYHTMSEMRDYFKQVEPDSTLNLPNIEDVPHHDWVEGMFKGMWDAAKIPGEAFQGNLDPLSPEGIKKTNELAMTMIGAPSALVESKAGDAVLGSFGGIRSMPKEKLADLGHAQVLEANGAHPDKIWHDTGLFRGYDNRWRYEIDDSKAEFNGEWSDPGNAFSKHGIALDTTYGPGGVNNTYNLRKWKTDEPIKPADLPEDLKPVWQGLQSGDKVQRPLSEIWDHPELYKAYPELKDVNVVHDPKYKGVAEWDGTNIIMGNKAVESKNQQGIIAHEVQHVIQDTEGFARGGMAGEPDIDFKLRYGASNLDFKMAMGKLNSMYARADEGRLLQSEEPEFERLQTLARTYLKYRDAAREQAHNNYMRLAGEVEARNTDTRLLLDAKDRRSINPKWTEDDFSKKPIVMDTPTMATAYGVRHPQTGEIVKSQADEPSVFRRAANDNTPETWDVKRERMGKIMDEIRGMYSSIDKFTPEQQSRWDFLTKEHERLFNDLNKDL